MAPRLLCSQERLRGLNRMFLFGGNTEELCNHDKADLCRTFVSLPTSMILHNYSQESHMGYPNRPSKPYVQSFLSMRIHRSKLSHDMLD